MMGWGLDISPTQNESAIAQQKNAIEVVMSCLLPSFFHASKQV